MFCKYLLYKNRLLQDSRNRLHKIVIKRSQTCDLSWVMLIVFVFYVVQKVIFSLNTLYYRASEIKQLVSEVCFLIIFMLLKVWNSALFRIISMIHILQPSHILLQCNFLWKKFSSCENYFLFSEHMGQRSQVFCRY